MSVDMQYTLIYIHTRIYTHMCVKSKSVTSNSVNTVVAAAMVHGSSREVLVSCLDSVSVGSGRQPSITGLGARPFPSEKIRDPQADSVVGLITNA